MRFARPFPALLVAAYLTAVFSLAGTSAAAEKTVYVPKAFKPNPSKAGGERKNALTEWSWERSFQSENFVVFWGPAAGASPAKASKPSLRFDPKSITAMLEAIYAKYVTEIGFCSDKPGTNLGRYKIIVVMNDTWGEGGPSGWAFGATYDDTIGAMWVHPDATRDGGVISHEFAHSLQGMISIQENKRGGGGGYVGWEPAGFFWECHANFMRTQMYPRFAGDDSARWMGTTMYHWSSTRHHYCNFRLLWHIQHLDGIQMVNRLWKESQPREHPLQTYRRLKKWSQEQLNDFTYDFATREVTFDYPANGFGAIVRKEYERLARDEPHFLWRRYAILDAVDAPKGHYACPDTFAPQDYGLNLIPLYPSGRTVRVKFKGHAEANDAAGWRYGFVAAKRDGTTARYCTPGSKPDGELTVTLAPDEAALYLVVTGAPAKQTDYVWEPGWPKIKRFPYEVRFDGAVPEGYQSDFRASSKKRGKLHLNGGGWVSDGAKVAATAYVGPRAIVLGRAVVKGQARVDGTARVEDATVQDQVVIDGNASVWRGTYSGDAHVTGNAVLSDCKVSGQALIRDNALEWGVALGGTIVVGGDAEITGGNTGVYLQCPHGNNGRKESDGAGADHPSNQDVNPPVKHFSAAEMRFDGERSKP